MNTLKIKKGDTVRVIAGKDKGKEGKVVQVFPNERKVVVENINTMKKHIKPQRRGDQGQTVDFSAPLHVSNVMILDPDSSKPSRIGYMINKDGSKDRIAKKSGRTV